MDALIERQAQHLQTFLRQEGITQQALCDELGFSPNTVNRWCRGKSRMRTASAELIHTRWPEYDVEWLQGAPGKSDLVVSAIKAVESAKTDLTSLRDAVGTLLLLGGYEVERLTDLLQDTAASANDDDSRRTPDFVIPREEYRLSKDGRECVLSGLEWQYLTEEVCSYMGMRVDAMLERGCW